MSFIYVASPYTHKDSMVVDARFELTAFCTALWCFQGLHAYSPIVHCHDISSKYNLPTDAQWWEDYNFSMLRHADSLFVLNLPGVELSKGVDAEVKLAMKLRITIVPHMWHDVKSFVKNFASSRVKWQSQSRNLEACIDLLEEANKQQ